MKLIDGQMTHITFHVDKVPNASKIRASIDVIDTGRQLFVTEWQSFSDEIEYKQCMTSVMLKAYHWQSERGQDETSN